MELQNVLGQEVLGIKIVSESLFDEYTLEIVAESIQVFTKAGTITSEPIIDTEEVNVIVHESTDEKHQFERNALLEYVGKQL